MDLMEYSVQISAFMAVTKQAEAKDSQIIY